jgi:TolB-like protein
MGREAYYGGDYANAIPRLLRVAGARAASARNRQEALRLVALSYIERNQEDSAAVALRRMLALEPPVVLLLPGVERERMWELYLEARLAQAMAKAMRAQPSSGTGPPVVAVYPFLVRALAADSGFDARALASGLQQLVLSEVIQYPSVRVVERETLRRTGVRAAGLSVLGSSEADSMVLRETHAVFGTLGARDGELFLTAWALDVERGDIVGREQLVAGNGDVFQLASTVTRRLIASIDERAVAGRAIGGAVGGPAPTGAPAGRGSSAAPPAMTPPRADALADSTGGAQRGRVQGAGAQPPGPPPSTSRAKVPFRAILLYSQALEAMDNGNDSLAVERLIRVLEIYPHESSRDLLAKLRPRGGG